MGLNYLRASIFFCLFIPNFYIAYSQQDNREKHLPTYREANHQHDLQWVKTKDQYDNGPKVTAAGCNNNDFENGDLSGWNVWHAYNYTFDHFYDSVPGTDPTRANVVSGNNINGCFPYDFPEVAPAIPGYPQGQFSCQLGNNQTGSQADRIEQTFTVGQNTLGYIYQFAIVLEFPQHPTAEQPYFEAIMFDQNGDTIPCSFFYIRSGVDMPGFYNGTPGSCSSWQVRPWDNIFVGLSQYRGQNVTIRFTVADCTAGAHFGYAFIDGQCVEIEPPVQNPCDLSKQGDTLKGPAGVFDYHWLPNGETTQDIYVTTEGTYTLQCTNIKGCSSELIYTFEKPEPLVVNTTKDNDIICFGNNSGGAHAIVSSGNGAYTYSWSGGQGTNDTLTTMPPGNYTITVTDSIGCIDTAKVTITQPPQLINSQITTPPGCGLSDGEIAVTSNGGTPSYSYSWAGSTNGDAPTATGLGSGSHKVVITDANGCKDSITVVIPTGNQPMINPTVTDIRCYGANDGSISTSVTGGGTPYTYLWDDGSTETALSNLGAGNYSLTVTDNAGCTNTANFTITEPDSVHVTETHQDLTCYQNTSGVINITAIGGTPTFTYNWSPNGSGAGSSSLTADDYTIVVSDANGCSKTIQVTLTEPPPLIIDGSLNNPACQASTGNILTNASGGTPNYTYSWNNGATAPQLNNIAAGNYVLTLTDANGCTKDSTIILQSAPPPTVTITPTHIQCHGELTGTATANVIGTSTPFQYSWPTSPMQNTSSANGLGAGNYDVLITDNYGCTATASTTITEPGPINLISDPDVTICINQSISINASASGGNPAYTYSWINQGITNPLSVSPASNTTYSVYVTDANGCKSDTQQVVVSVNPPLNITATNPPAVCAGSSSTINISASGSGGNYNLSYSWLAPLNTNGNQVSVNPTQTTTYTVILTDNCGTPADTTTVTVNIHPLPVISFTGIDTTGCTPVCATFNYAINPNYTYTWSYGDGVVTNATEASHCYKTPGIYSVGVSITDQNGCTATSNHPNMIEVYGYPDANFSFSPEQITSIENEIHFTDLSFGATQWTYSFGDGQSTTNIPSPEHEYLGEDAEGYTVWQIVSNDHGCKDSIEKYIPFIPEWSLYVPNTFTPNSDGHNDGFIPKAVGIKEFEMWIYDRWGNEIYHCTNLTEPWTGKVQRGYSHEVAQIDTYVWVILYRDIFDKSHRQIGHVNLIK